jgi:hypothetical protein
MSVRTLVHCLMSTSLVLSFNCVAFAASAPPDVSRASEMAASSKSIPDGELKVRMDVRKTLPGLPLLAEAYYADTCYTFAGPTCPMLVLVPEGAPCTCIFPAGRLSGQAW